MAYVQFFDEAETVIIASFGAPQDPAVYPYFGEVEDDDARYLAFLDTLTAGPSLADQVMAERDSRLAYATLQIAPLQDLVDIDEATPEDEAKLLAWKKYRAAVGKVPQQAGFPDNVIWPVQPAI